MRLNPHSIRGKRRNVKWDLPSGLERHHGEHGGHREHREEMQVGHRWGTDGAQMHTDQCRLRASISNRKTPSVCICVYLWLILLDFLSVLSSVLCDLCGSS